jgi:hypothetical protein
MEWLDRVGDIADSLDDLETRSVGQDQVTLLNRPTPGNAIALMPADWPLCGT